MGVVYYANGHILRANFQEMAHLTKRDVSSVIRRIETLSLRMVLDKTEAALLFHGPSRVSPPLVPP